MPEIIKHRAVVNDDWNIVPRDQPDVPAGEKLLLPVMLWQEQQNTLAARNDIGVWFDSDQQATPEMADRLQQLPIIAIHFPVFTDGRGFSIARLLRERYGYKGELRAIGYVLRDQLCFMKRCGFDSFVLQPGVDLHAALQSLDDFTDSYQTSVDQPEPLFRRA